MFFMPYCTWETKWAKNFTDPKKHFLKTCSVSDFLLGFSHYLYHVHWHILSYITILSYPIWLYFSIYFFINSLKKVLSLYYVSPVYKNRKTWSLLLRNSHKSSPPSTDSFPLYYSLVTQCGPKTGSISNTWNFIRHAELLFFNCGRICIK